MAEYDVVLNITELDIGFPKGSADNLGASDYAKQGHLYRQFMDVFLEEPNMGEFVIWGLTDAHSWLDGQQGKTQGLLYDKQYKAKPAYDRLVASLKAHSPESVVSPYPKKTIESSSSTVESSSSETIGIQAQKHPQNLSMHLAGHILSISGTTSATIDVFDMQGRPIFSAKNVKGSIELKNISEGLYVIRVREGSASLTKRMSIK